MADLGAIFSFVSSGSSLALNIFTLATVVEDGKFLGHIAKSISNASLTVKQIGTIIKEDDSLPSAEAVQNLDEILESSNSVLEDLKAVFQEYGLLDSGSIKHNRPSQQRSYKICFSQSDTARLEYLQAHLEALKSTVSVMLQTFYTAQVIIWARTRDMISPQQATSAVENEKVQLENLIIEQQISILLASKSYHPARPDAKLLMDKDSSQSIIAKDTDAPRPVELFPYQERYIASLDTVDTSEDEWLPFICGISKSHLEHLLERWTRLRQKQESIIDAERRELARRRENQQATVESDSEEEEGQVLPFRSRAGGLANPTPRRPGSVQPLFTETNSLPIPVPEPRFGPTAPMSPVSSSGGSPLSSFITPTSHLPPNSPRSSISSLPVEAAAAVDAKDHDDDVDLEIPWRLTCGTNYWEYIDGKVKKTNTDLPPSYAFSDGKSRTEILASWVCKEAIHEAAYDHTTLSKLSKSRRTKIETMFSIHQALTFAQVHHLVEHTVELFRQKQPPSPPPPPPRRSSFNQHRSVRPSLDRERTPRAAGHGQAPTQPPPPFERSNTVYAYQPGQPHPPPPPLDRSMSMPIAIPPYPNKSTSIPKPPSLHLPIPPNPYIPQTQAQTQTPTSPFHHPPPPMGLYSPNSQLGPYSPQPAQHQPQPGPYSPQTLTQPQPTGPFNSPQLISSPFFAPTTTPIMSTSPDSRRQNTYPQSPLRQSFANASSNYHNHHQYHQQHNQHPQSTSTTSTTSTTSDSDTAPSTKLRDRERGDRDRERERERDRERERERRYSSRSRRPSGSSYNKRRNRTVGTLAKVGGLAALLDGIVDLGVL